MVIVMWAHDLMIVDDCNYHYYHLHYRLVSSSLSPVRAAGLYFSILIISRESNRAVKLAIPNNKRMAS